MKEKTSAHPSDLNEKEYFPRAIEIETNTSCNRRCSHCPNSIYDRGLIENEQLMPPVLFHKIIDELSELEYNGKISPVFYGEPLLDGRIEGFMRYARKKLPDSHILIYTNGDFLTPGKYFELVEAGVDEFLVTQHAEDIPAGIKKLNSHFGGKPGLPVPITYQTFTPETELYNRGGLLHVPAKNPVPGCAYEWIMRIVIDYKGDVILCNNDYFGSVTFGNLQEEKLIDIWMNQKYRDIRKRLRDQQYTLPLCRKCTEGYDPEKTRKTILAAKIQSMELFEEDPGDRLDITALPELPDSTNFNVECIEIHEKKYLLKGPPGIRHGIDKILVIKGWAIDSSSGTPAAGVFIAFDSGHIYRSYYSLDRPDVADNLKNTNLKETGFFCTIPLDVLPEGLRVFRLKIVSETRRGYYYPENKFSIEIPF